MRQLQISRYGWRPGLPDIRDYEFLAHLHTAQLPTHLYIRDYTVIPPYDQFALGSCTANAIAFLLQHRRLIMGLRNFIPSRLMIYLEERRIEGTVNEDAGAEIRDGMSVVHKLGACDEHLWPYKIENFKKRPPAADYKAALDDQAVEYQAILNSTATNIKMALYQGYPVAFGFTVYESFESDEVANTGVVPMPKKGEDRLGGHAVAIVGYDDSRKMFYVRNSWGTDWGISGYFWMPYAYVTNKSLADDFWIIKDVG